MKLGNPKNTIEVIQKYDFDFQKKFGQNFLIDERVLEKIISAAEVNKDDFVLEIGPGIGTMTQYLAENAREVMAVEIDKNLIPILSDTLSAYDNVSILNADILKVDIAKIVEEKNGGKPVKVVANITLQPRSSWDCLKAMCRSTVLLSWYRKKLQTACSQVREQKTMVHYHSQCSTMQNHMW